MHHFIDIKVMADPDLPQHQLLSALFTKLHRELARGKGTSIGVSFPQFSLKPPGLGTVLRIFGPADALDHLMTGDWMGAARHHVAISGIEKIPGHAQARTLRRVQAKSSAERLRRRIRKRHGISDSEARSRIPDTVEQTLPLPYLAIPSASTGQRFPLFLQLGSPQAHQEGNFNTYGLSATATIPWF